VKRLEREHARALYRQLGERAAPEGGFANTLPPFNAWVREVQAIHVELHPGGRATLTRTGLPTVAIRWEMRVGGRGGRQRFLTLTSLHIDAEPGGAFSYLGLDLVLSCYVAALALVVEHDDEPVPNAAAVPAAGKPPSIDFYRRLNAEYDELVRSGHRTPLKELAARYKTKEGTVKSWRSRGSKYLRGTQ
jgi:hypothetical protein